METFCIPGASDQKYYCCFRSSCTLPFCKYAAQNYRCYSELASPLNGITILCAFCTEDASMHHMVSVLGKIYCLLFQIRSSHKLTAFLSLVPLPSDLSSIVNLCICFLFPYWRLVPTEYHLKIFPYSFIF